MGRDDASLAQAYHVESWLTDVVLVRETAREAEIASLEKLNGDVHRARFVVYIDQEKGRCLAYSTSGKLLANFQLGEKNQAPLTGVRLINRRGNLRLERLQVSHWSGAPPREDVALDKPRVQLTNGTIQYGELSSYDAAAKTFTLRGSANASRSTDQVESVFLGQSFDPAPQPLCVGYQDSTRLCGRLLKVEHKKIWLASPCVREPLQLPVEGLRSLVVNGSASGPLEAPDGVRIGILEAEGVRLFGFLVDGAHHKEASCLVWNPRGGGTASPLRAIADGKIVYREPPPPPPVPHEQPRPQRRMRRVVVQNNNGVVIRRLDRKSARRRAAGTAARFDAQGALPDDRRHDPLRSHADRSERHDVQEPELGFDVCAARKDQGGRVDSRRPRPRLADAHKTGPPADASPPAKGKSAHASDPLARRRLSPRPDRRNGRQTAGDGSPHADAGNSARTNFADHLAASG